MCILRIHSSTLLHDADVSNPVSNGCHVTRMVRRIANIVQAVFKGVQLVICFASSAASHCTSDCCQACFLWLHQQNPSAKQSEYAVLVLVLVCTSLFGTKKVMFFTTKSTFPQIFLLHCSQPPMLSNMVLAVYEATHLHPKRAVFLNYIVPCAAVSPRC